MADQAKKEVLVELVTDEKDFEPIFDCVREAFGRQAKNGIWMAVYPDWDTADSTTFGIRRMAERWRTGNSNIMHLKATIPDPAHPGQRVIVGFAIWSQLSIVQGQGETPKPAQPSDFEHQYRDNEPERRYVSQMLNSLYKQRCELVKEKAKTDSLAVMALDLCAVHPYLQRKGSAGKLVQWGLDEAKRRGGLEAITEASSMGRGAYVKLGFKPVGGDTMYVLDEEFRERQGPLNVFMRTGVFSSKT